MPNVICAILGGGRGSRLFPLTKERCKPAVPVGGKYRLIDIPISNCLNSGYSRIYVITQFNTASLHRHIARTYPFDAMSGRFVEVLAAQQTLGSADWYQGTADAVRQNLSHMRLGEASHLLILSGDHLYRMDYSEMTRYQDQCGADAVLAAQPVTGAQARKLGILKVDSEGGVIAFAEKPQDEALLREFTLPCCPERQGAPNSQLTHMASLGIYLFRPDVLRDLLASSTHEDFGRQVIPSAIDTHKVVAFPFESYWEDIGTIPAFYRANLDLAAPLPRFNLYDQSWPIYTRARYLPPAKLQDAQVDNSFLAEGAIVSGCRIANSIIGLRSIIRPNCMIRDSVVMGYDYYEPAAPVQLRPDQPTSACPSPGIGPRCGISGAVLDKNVSIGEAVVIRGQPGSGIDEDTEAYYVRDGIVVVPRNAVVPAGTEIVV